MKKPLLSSTLLIMGILFLGTAHCQAQVVRAIVTGPKTAEIIYRSHKGVTYGALAKRFSVADWRELRKINGYSEKRIFIGKELRIPVSLEVAEPYIIADKNQLTQLQKKEIVPVPQDPQNVQPMELSPSDSEQLATIESQKKELSALTTELSNQKDTLEKMQQELHETKQSYEQQKEELAKLSASPPVPLVEPQPAQPDQGKKTKKANLKKMAATIQQQKKEIESLQWNLEEVKMDLIEANTALNSKQQPRFLSPEYLTPIGTGGLGLLLLAGLGFGWKTNRLKKHYQNLLFSERVELSIPGKNPHVYIPEKTCRPGTKECRYTALHITPSGTLHQVASLDDLKDSAQRTLKSYYTNGSLTPAIKKMVDQAFKSNRLGELRS